jgi:RNA polymerase sigma-70 factor (ECF subfamily)
MIDEIEKLIKLIKKRNPKALETVMELYLSSAYGVAKSILGDICSKEDIEECIQDVFVDVWNKIDDFNENRGSFKTWVLIICKYKALNLRKALTKQDVPLDLDEVQCPSTENLEDSILSKESTQEVLNIINSFADTDRAIFIRRYFLHQGIDYICESMNLSRQSVDNRLWRGRKKLKKSLDLVEGGTIND